VFLLCFLLSFVYFICLYAQSEYTFSISESGTENTLVGEVRATDADSSSFGPIVFELGGGIGREDFKLFQPLVNFFVF
jgi:hypothetical protein